MLPSRRPISYLLMVNTFKLEISLTLGWPWPGLWSWPQLRKHFLQCKLDLVPMTLILKFEVDKVKRYHHSKIRGGYLYSQVVFVSHRNPWISTKSADFKNCFPDVALLEVEGEMRIFSNFDGNPRISSKIREFQVKISRFWWKSTDFHENPQISVDFAINLVKLTFSFHSRVRIQRGNIFFQPKSMDFSIIHISPL